MILHLVKKQLSLVKASSGDRLPPTEFRIWSYGEVRTTKGTFRLSRSNAQSILADRADQDAEVMIDWEHEALDPDREGPRPAAGWCRLEARADGLWAVNVRWSPTATQLLSTAEYRYFSPAFEVSKRTGEITRLINIALTNLPATKDIQALVAASRMSQTRSAKTRKKIMTLKERLAKKLKKTSAEDMAKKCGLPMERFSKIADGEEPTPEEMKACKAAFGDDEDDDTEETSIDTDEVETASDDEIDETDHEEDVVLTRKELIALTGTKDPAKQRGRIAAMKEKAMRYDDDHKTLVQLKKDRETEKRAALVKTAKDEKKVTPASLRYWAKRPVDEFEEFLASAPRISGEELDEPEAGDDKRAVVLLSREDREVAKLMNRDPEETAKFLAAQKSGENAKAILASYRVNHTTKK